MWNIFYIVQALAWAVLIFTLPFAFVFLRKTVSYISYKVLPRDTIIQINDNGKIESAYYVKFSIFRKASIRELSKKELDRLGAST